MAERGGFRSRGGARGGAGDRGGRRGGAGGGGGAGGDKADKPKKENILDLSKYLDKPISVKFSGGREGEPLSFILLVFGVLLCARLSVCCAYVSRVWNTADTRRLYARHDSEDDPAFFPCGA